ncbi:MAG: HEAT repeat domain-containing protein, partial [Planctomycetaceae bacterium]|nr:HEAT repeat domain-containing protein [Planctomycetaceae bacterium]
LAVASGLTWCPSALAAEPQTGPATEKRFPPLVVPDGFKATLFACDPLIEYPSAIALGPQDKPASVFVAIDYMTGLGTEIVRRDEIRLVEDTDADGYADNSTVYADGFNSIQGLTSHAGTIYAMHSPFLTALRDTDGDGQADERRDLLKGLGLPPEENDVRLHCANGIVMGHDGWLYLALGDHGCDVLRPEGDRLVHEGGAILRCRPDGRDLHVFARGLRNIYDVALDDELNVFVRDNENDGGDYKLRLCYSFWGADHGYPYLYYERPGEALAPLADLGLGSSAGGVSYLERQFPEEYHGSLLFCEWGRAVVRSHPRRAGAGFAPLAESQFASGAESDPYGFKPTDLVVLRDGSLVVADWCDGQRPKRGRGRIYRIRYAGQRADKPADPPLADGPAELLSQLNAASYYERIEAQGAIEARGPQGVELVQRPLAEKDRLTVHARMHAVWILARDGSPSAREKLFDLIQHDADARVRVQAVRAIADLTDPMLVAHRLDVKDGDRATSARMAGLASGQDARVVLEIAIALGRSRWPNSPEWLPGVLGARPDPVLMHAAMQTLRRSENWPLVLKLLDLPSSEPMRAVALAAVADQAIPEVADGLIARLADDDAARRTEYADALSRVYKKPGPWKYWGYRPPPRPANSVAWVRTEDIEQALDGLLRDADRPLRLAVLQRMQREEIPVRLATLTSWLAGERAEPAVAAILKSIPREPAEKRREALALVITERDHALANRLAAIELVEQDRAAKPAASNNGLDSAFLLDLAALVEDGPVLAELLHRIGNHKQQDARKLLASKLGSPQGEVRVAAIGGLVKLGQPDAGAAITPLLDDHDAAVRAAAAEAVGRLQARAAVGPLLRLAGDDDPLVRRACLDSLRRLGEPKAVPLAVAALADRTTQLAALACLAELGGPEQSGAVIDAVKIEPSEDAVNLAVGMLTKWSSQPGVPSDGRSQMEQSVGELQGQSGLVLSWRMFEPLSADELTATMKRLAAGEQVPNSSATLARGAEGSVTLAGKTNSDGTWLAYADLLLQEPAPVQWIAAATGPFSVWLNGQRIYERSQPRQTLAELDRFDATLVKGANRVVVHLPASATEIQFQLRFRRKSSAADLERLVQAALAAKGNPDRGRQVFFDAKAQCSKCHRIGNQGERIGPELTGIGNRFSRIHIVESILEPSRTVTPGFQTIAVRLADGRTASGIRVAETDKSLTLADQKGQKITFAKEEIEAQQSQPKSTMPDGLAQQLSVEQFRDLVAFLVSQQDARGP